MSAKNAETVFNLARWAGARTWDRARVLGGILGTTPAILAVLDMVFGVAYALESPERGKEAEADWLGLQYMYKAGYDPQAFIQFFEKIDALEKHKPGTLAKVFADHPQTPDRIAHSEEEIATIMPAKPDYVVTTSEFDDVKTRLARIENKRKLMTPAREKRPSLRRASTVAPNSPASDGDAAPALERPDSDGGLQ